MATHSHRFVETYTDMVGYGFDRQTDENTIVYYLQKFSDDALIQTMVKRMSDQELKDTFEFVSALMQRHLSEAEYHRLFLKDE